MRKLCMIPGQDILNYLRVVPFRPFWLHTASGRTLAVRHPEMARVGLMLFTYVTDDPDIFDRWDTVSLMLIENVTHLEATAA